MLSFVYKCNEHLFYLIYYIFLQRNLRSFAFAKLYLNVGELELARRYISSYLTVKPNSAEAHQFLGKILEKLGRRDAALEEYRNSLDLDPKQSGLILKGNII